MNVPPILVFGWGNPSRGDDALGPMFVDAIEARHLPGVECLTDFQLQVEHALDLCGRQRVLFVDAGLDTSFDDEAGFRLSRLTAHASRTANTHAMDPQALLQVYVDMENAVPPEAWLLLIRGASWELGEGLSPSAQAYLAQALQAGLHWLTWHQASSNHTDSV